jgi:dipeptidyl aminopeptidase/acylaminoacyl peptidase
VAITDTVKQKIDETRARVPAFDHLIRMNQHYGAVKGNALAGAVTYFGFLSFFPILALAFAVVGVVSAVYDVEEQRTVLRLTEHDSEVSGVQDWHPDGEHVSFTHGTELRGRAVDGSGEHEPLLEHDASVDRLRWSHAEGRLAFSAATEEGTQLLLSDTQGSEPSVVASFDERITSIAWSPDDEWLALSGDLGEEGNGIYLVPLEAPQDITHVHTFSEDTRSGHVDW